jgi:hypothetical protein
MTWVQIQKAQDTTWEDYERVSKAVGDEAPDGLIVHAAGEEEGKWLSVSVWESEEHANRFRDQRLMPAVTQALGEQAVAAGPPPQEAFEAKHVIKP